MLTYIPNRYICYEKTILDIGNDILTYVNILKTTRAGLFRTRIYQADIDSGNDKLLPGY